MEIHPPHKPVKSLQEFLVHILVVFIGILLALGGERISEALHHRHLAHQARRYIQAEMRNNRAALAVVTANKVQVRKATEELLKNTAPNVDKAYPGPIATLPDRQFGQLSSTAWQTALSTQAVLYMDFREVQNYAQLYQLQTAFNDVQNSDIHVWFQLAGYDENLSRNSPQDLTEAKRLLRETMSYSQTLEGTSDALEKSYAALLGKSEE